MTSVDLSQMKALIAKISKDPSILNESEYGFLKDFVQQLGGKVPTTKQANGETGKTESPAPESESEESDLEFDMTGVIGPDNDEPQPMGDSDMVPTEEQIEESQNKRSDAVSAFIEKDYEKAIKLYTEAIVLNPQAALLYAKRGQVYLMLNKPNACIRDCNRAIELNPDSAAGFKFRGRAYQLLGKWEEAANDLRTACRFDFDEQADEWLKEVTPNAKLIEEQKRKKERKLEEKAEREKAERMRKVREAQEKARKEAEKQKEQEESGGGPDFFQNFLKDPEIIQAFSDPEVRAAYAEISQNPSAIMKYQDNPKIMALITKIAARAGGGKGFGGMGGMGGMGGGMGGFGGMGGGMGGDFPGAPPKPEDGSAANAEYDFNLD